MISLHNIDTTDESAMKAVMKGRSSSSRSSLISVSVVFTAVTLLFQERTIYNQEVLSVVLQQLMDQSPLPTLFMRTVVFVLTSVDVLAMFVVSLGHSGKTGLPSAYSVHHEYSIKTNI